MTVDASPTALLAEADARLQDVGRQLFSFTSAGEYGRYFNGANSIRFTAPLVVLELEELKSRRHLQQVVLLLLIYQIQQAMYLGERGQQKLVVIDEAWDLLTNGDVGRFIESGYRRFRKYGGAAVTITQSLADLYTNPVGRAIAENSANSFLLAQPAQAIDQLAAEQRLPMPAGAAELLKTVHTVPGAYSEIFCLTTLGGGIGRLVVDPFRRLLYSTAPQDVAALDAMQAQGLGTVEAIQALIEERRHGAESARRRNLTRACVAAMLLAAALAGAIGGAGRIGSPKRGGDRCPAPPPVIILSVADVLLAGRDAGQIRGLADRLADGGFVVLDAQAVLAAPDALYLPFGKGALR